LITDSSKPHKQAVKDRLVDSQADSFVRAARAAECDEDEARWEEKLRKVAKHKPKPDAPADS
jgi:hypothetical protein